MRLANGSKTCTPHRGHFSGCAASNSRMPASSAGLNHFAARLCWWYSSKVIVLTFRSSRPAFSGRLILGVRWQQHIYYRVVFRRVWPSLCAVKQCAFTGSIKLLRKVVFRCRSPFRRTHCAIETNHCAARPVWAQVIRFFAVKTVHRSNLSINPDGYAAGYLRR